MLKYLRSLAPIAPEILWCRCSALKIAVDSGNELLKKLTVKCFDDDILIVEHVFEHVFDAAFEGESR